VLAPAGTPKAVINRLNADIVKVMGEAEMKKQMLGAGIDARSSTPEQFAATIKADTLKWVKIVKTAGARLD
jgi:tripartite-type tricarboxylate transporter receptor subunit TctC